MTISSIGQDISSVKLLELLPEGLKRFEEFKWLCAAIQPEIDEIIEIISNKILFTYLDKLDDITLDYLLLETGIANSIEIVFINNRQDKINFIQNYVKLNKLRGTKAGIEYVFDLIGINADIQEWFEYGGEPYNFKIQIPPEQDLPLSKLASLMNLVKAYKNTRSHYSLDDNKELLAPLKIGQLAVFVDEITLQSADLRTKSIIHSVNLPIL